MAKLRLERLRFLSSGSCQAGDFSVPSFPSEAQLCCSNFYIFIPPSTLTLPVNNIPHTCECLVLLLRSPLCLWAMFCLQFLVLARFSPCHPSAPSSLSCPASGSAGLTSLLHACGCNCFFFCVLKIEEFIKNKRSAQSQSS